VTHDIEGALRAGMTGVLVHRSHEPLPSASGVRTIRTLRELLPPAADQAER
jgi:FMN phosphatase YigB (HAD superfamily)